MTDNDKTIKKSFIVDIFIPYKQHVSCYNFPVVYVLVSNATGVSLNWIELATRNT